QGTNISRAANSRSVAEHVRSFLHRLDDLLLFTFSRIFQITAGASQCARTDQRAGPGAKIFRAEAIAHHLLDVDVDLVAFDIDKLTFVVSVLENLGGPLLQQ